MALTGIALAIARRVLRFGGMQRKIANIADLPSNS
jgi:hypothetical protein